MGLISDDNRGRIPELTTGDRVPLHPALTDVPVATLSLAPVFDAIALATGSRSAGAAGLWSGATAVLWALPTAATGTLDYLRARSGSPVKRIGIAHAALNTFALAMMTSSLISRRFRSEPTPLSLLFSAAAGAAVTYSSHLGGVMVYREGMRVSGEGLRAIGDAWTQTDGAQTDGRTTTGLPTREATIGRVTTPVDEWAAGGPVRSTVGPAAGSPLGGGGSDATTIGGVAEDSPDTHDAGMVASAAGGETGMAAAATGLGGPEEVPGPLDVEAPPPGASDDLLIQTSGREQWDMLDRLETAVEEGRESPDDITLDEGGTTGGERPDEELGGQHRAA